MGYYRRARHMRGLARLVDLTCCAGMVPAPTKPRLNDRCMDVKTGHQTLGRLLRSLRSSKGWTLKEMSQGTGISISTLSKVEHDHQTLTYDKLVQLSQRLNIGISELFGDPAAIEPAVTARRSIGSIDDAVRVTTKNYDYHYLCPELRRKRMIPIFIRIRAKNAEEFGELVRHSGEEYIYVLKGAIKVLTEPYVPVVLNEGESIYLDSNMGHAYVTAEECDEAVVLGVCSSNDEGLIHSLMSLHRETEAALPPSSQEPTRPLLKTLKKTKRR